MMENAKELWSWLEQGAHFYVCGDASRMAKDVDKALHEIVKTAGDRSEDAAGEYIQKAQIRQTLSTRCLLICWQTLCSARVAR